MPRLTLRPDQKVEAAYYELNITLKRAIEGSYGADDLASTTFRVPVGAEDSHRKTITDALINLRRTFEAGFGPVVPAADIRLGEDAGKGDSLSVETPF